MLDNPSPLQLQIIAFATERAPTLALRYGEIADIARLLDTSKEWAHTTLTQSGFRVIPRLDRDAPCAAEGCPNRVGERGGMWYCRGHYRRLKRYGDPLGVGQRVRGENSRPAAERMLERVDFDGPGGCWLLPARGQDGYATVATDELRGNGRPVYMPAHRFMWFLVYGRCPVGELDHLCYRRNCVRLDHLEEIGRRAHLERGNERRRRERAAYRLLEELHPELMASL